MVPVAGDDAGDFRLSSYVSGNKQLMFAGNATKLYDVTSAPSPRSCRARTSGNYAAAQLSNQGGDWMVVVNETGDPPLRFNAHDLGDAELDELPADWANGHAYAVGDRATDTVDVVILEGAGCPHQRGDGRIPQPTGLRPSEANWGSGRRAG